MEVYCDSMFGTFIPAFLFAIAQTEIDSSVTSILNSLTPLNTLVLGALVLALVLKNRFGVF
jgi:drug/metabolite transporter (DMT)-like permease